MRSTILLFLGIILIGAPLIAQTDSITEVNFIYDAAGNRTKRENTYYVAVFKSAMITDTEEEITPEEGLMVYPNPVSHTIFVILNQEAMDQQQRSITIYDNLGKIVKQVLAPQETNQIDVSSLSNGTYILKLTFGNKHKEWIIIKS
jgi:putative heme degradation protein